MVVIALVSLGVVVVIVSLIRRAIQSGRREGVPAGLTREASALVYFCVTFITFLVGPLVTLWYPLPLALAVAFALAFLASRVALSRLAPEPFKRLRRIVRMQSKK